MFRQEGVHRSDRHNQLVAGYLAVVAGWVNSASLVIIGSFTSHVTGNIGRFADDLALGKPAAALRAAGMVVAFFTGAFLASVAIESNTLPRRPWVYAALQFGEAGLLLGFLGLSWWMVTADPRLHDAQAMVLCAAMGLQNSLVTRLSGAVVRTTHLTGVVTDLGIESARWFRYWRSRMSERMSIRLVVGPRANLRPSSPKTFLLLTILSGFVLGSGAGALLTIIAGGVAFVAPAMILVTGGLLALRSGFALPSDAERT
jgi:uncharacterized membrane protein YoaK (UPF0700 family)